MKFFIFLLWALPFLATAQALPPTTTPAALAAPSTAVRDSSAGWEVKLEGYQRTSYLGREYGSFAYSIAPQIIYSAASGFYGSLEGLFFSPVTPAYVYTSLEVGYAGEFTDNWSYSLSGNRTFYTGRVTKADSVLRNCLEAYTAYDFGPVSLGVDYNFLFDRFHAHTLGLALSVPLEKTHWLGFDKVSFTPSAELDWGSSLALLRFGPLATPLDPSFTSINQPNLKLVPLAYEFTFPLEVQRGSLALNVTGHLLAPLRISGESQRPASFGYLSAAVILRFPRWPSSL